LGASCGGIGDHGAAVAAGPTTLAGLEQEIESLRKAMEKEAAEVASMQAGKLG